jgi:hypothetical protein
MKYSITFISDLLVYLWILAHCEFLEALHLFTSASPRIVRESGDLDSNSDYYKRMKAMSRVLSGVIIRIVGNL